MHNFHLLISFQHQANLSNAALEERKDLLLHMFRPHLQSVFFLFFKSYISEMSHVIGNNISLGLGRLWV